MSVKLYKGCWGVRFEGDVVGPIDGYRGEWFKSPDGVSYTQEGWVILWGNAAGDRIRPYHMYRIEHVFPDEASARAWMNRGPWWKRAWAYVVKWWYPTWAKHWAVKRAIDVAVVVLLLLLLTACDNPTRPPEYKCYNDGTPIDCETGVPIKEVK